MGQKIHPLGFRIGITQKHRAQWFAKPKEYSNYIQEDQLIRDFLSQQLSGGLRGQAPRGFAPSSGESSGKAKMSGGDAGLSKTLLSRRADRLLVEVHVAQPKVVTGEAGARLKELTAGIQKIQESQAIYRASVDYRSSFLAADASSPSPDETPKVASSVSLHVVQVAQPATDATLLAQKVAQQLEKRVAFRRIMKQTIQQAREAGVEGIKIQISGRLNGAEIARREWAREGRVPLHTLRADIDYCAYPAQTIYGLLGIKIWIYKTS